MYNHFNEVYFISNQLLIIMYGRDEPEAFVGYHNIFTHHS